MTSDVYPGGLLVGNMNTPFDLVTGIGLEVDLAEDFVLAVESIDAEARGLKGRDRKLESRTRWEEREASRIA